MIGRVGIVGAGASGLAAAIAAARDGAQVKVIEHMDKAGKKILSTGSGRCNLSNRKMDASCFRCGQDGFPMKVIGGFGLEETLGFFEGLGIRIRLPRCGMSFCRRRREDGCRFTFPAI